MLCESVESVPLLLTSLCCVLSITDLEHQIINEKSEKEKKERERKELDVTLS